MKTRLLKSHSGSLEGTVAIPGDKSISHRSVMFGSISQGVTTVTNFLPGDDCLSTISCFRKLGVKIEEHASGELRIYGSGFQGLNEPKEVLNVGNSGTTIRLMMGILAGRDFFSVLEGDESIARRPMTRVATPLSQMGAKIDFRNGGFAPISVRGGALNSFEYKLPVASAQVKSALLFAALQAEGETVITEPEETRDHTERMIRQFGGTVEKEGKNIKVKGGQNLKGTSVRVPGDISSAAFFLVAGAISEGSSITLENVGLNPTRSGIVDVLNEMGADLQILSQDLKAAEPVGTLLIRSSGLKGTTVGGEMIPRLIDEIPIIALLATQADGVTVIKDAAELKVKETNRIDTVVGELKKMGANIEATDDGMIIQGPTALHGASVSSHGDHRIGMMLAVASLISEGETILENPEAISVSYPKFFEDLDRLKK